MIIRDIFFCLFLFLDTQMVCMFSSFYFILILAVIDVIQENVPILLQRGKPVKIADLTYLRWEDQSLGLHMSV